MENHLKINLAATEYVDANYFASKHMNIMIVTHLLYIKCNRIKTFCDCNLALITPNYTVVIFKIKKYMCLLKNYLFSRAMHIERFAKNLDNNFGLDNNRGPDGLMHIF